MAPSVPSSSSCLLAAAVLWGVALNLGGCAQGPEEPVPTLERGLRAEPGQLAFVCVLPGCDTTQKLRVRVLGDRRVALKRILLDGESKDDFVLTPSQQPPFIVGANDTFELDLRYVPRGAPPAGDAHVVLSYTDAEASESPDRIAPGELRVPLLRRLVGEPWLVAQPERIRFGVVKPGEEKTVSLRVENAGFGNMALELQAVDAGTPLVRARMPEVSARTLPPDAGVDLPVTFAPTQPLYLRSQLVVSATSEGVAPAVVEVEGTSLSISRLAVEPDAPLDFGVLPKAAVRTRTLTLVNQGGAPVAVSGVTVVDATGSVEAHWVDKETAVVLGPLERAALEVRLSAQVPGDLEALLRITSNDAARPVLELPVKAQVTEPALTLMPESLDFGTVPVGWVVSRSLELRNTGTGPLTVKNVALVSGSSSLFTLRHLPGLPAVLGTNERLAVELEFRAEASASFQGFLSVETDAPGNGFSEVALKAVGGSCSAGCPIANGTPVCTRGVCSVGSCQAGYYDTDGLASSGCECKEEGVDPGSFCANAADKGTLKDTSKAQTSHTGIVPTADDVDVVRFYAEDALSFSDNFDVKVRLESNDSSIQMCVYRYDTKSHQSECYFTNETCPTTRSFRKTSSGGGDDGADFIVKVFRAASSAPSCTPYTLFLSNGL